MLFVHWRYTLGVCCLSGVLLWGSALYTYFINHRLQEGDENKLTYSPYAAFALPLFIPFYLILVLAGLILMITVAAIILPLFALALLLLRKPFLFKWLHDRALEIGHFVMDVNMKLLKVITP